MDFNKKNVAIAFGALVSAGMVGQASADVYGLSYLDIDNLNVGFSSLSGGAGLYTFSSNQDAVLNDVTDFAAANASCAGTFGGATTCSIPSPTLSGKVQNAPPASAGVRGEGDYTKFGMVGDYSNAEAEILSAVVTGDPITHAASISESNLDTGTSAQAYTEIASNVAVNLMFDVGPAGTFSISFDAVIDLHTEVTNGDLGIAQAATGATLLLQKEGTTLASWAPNGGNGLITCAAGLVCTSTESMFSLNNTSSSDGTPHILSGSGSYSLEVTGLSSGRYTLAFNLTTSTDLFRVPVPVPGTLLLAGTGLLLGAREIRSRPR